VNIYGPDLDHLDREAQQIARVLNGMPGATEVQMQSPPGAPEIAVALRTPELLQWGFDPVSALQDSLYRRHPQED
jgi:Cu/Ag efflux pump CusA